MSQSQRVPEVLTDAQRATLRAVLNRIVPASDGFPGAGDLEIGAIVEWSLATALIRRLFLDGLATIELTSWQQSDADFVELGTDRQDTVLQSVEAAAPFFFDQLVGLTYRAYYADPTVLARLGAESRPPQPLGYHLPAFDPERLAKVRARGPIYRTVNR